MEDRERANEVIYKDEQEYLDELNSVLSLVGNNLHKFVEDGPRAIADPKLDLQALQTLQKETRNLQNNVDLLVQPLVTSKEEETDRIAKLQFRYDELYSKWESQESQLGKAQEEIFRLKNQVMHQSTFCASLGAVMGNLVWRASRFPQIIDVWLSGFQNKVGEFLCIANGSFVSFINTYGAVFPPISSDECQFVMGLLGIVTNMSASPEGRQFLVTNPNGKDLVQKLVKLMPSVPLPSGSCLKRLTLMILYNVSVNETGLRYLFELQVEQVLSHCLEESVPKELQLLCLRLLQSITYELNDLRKLQDVLKSVTIKRIERLAEGEQDRIATTAREILDNLEKSQKALEPNAERSIDKKFKPKLPL